MNRRILAFCEVVCLMAIILCGFVFVPTSTDTENVVVQENIKELLSEVGVAVSKMQDDLVVYTNFDVERTELSLPNISKEAQKIDPFTSGLLKGMKYNITKENGLNKIFLQFYYYIGKEEHRRLITFAEEFATKIQDLSDYEKIKYTHDYLVENCTYNIEMDGPYNCIFNQQSNCNGYALSFCLIMQACNIECKYVTGTDHAWNAVRLGSFWYNIDVTWDDGGESARYDYFLCGRSDWKKHRTKEATAGYHYKENEFLNWAGTVFYWGWPVLVVLAMFIVWKIRKVVNR